ncbi:DNA repair protein rad2, partial [Gamsiella multidivaricata]
MGVKGLWELLHPVARPIKLDSLSNKYLAIDASIWLHQFLRGMRDKEGQVVGNAHIIGFFRRICKLLFFNIKPIFVFDGGTPALKRLTIQERRKRKKQDANMVKRTAEKLLAAQLRLRAIEQRKAARKKKTEEKQDKLSGVIHDSEESPNYLDAIQSDDTVFAEKQALSATKLKAEAGLGSQAKRIKDKYVLPPMEIDFDTLSKIRSNDERFGYQADDDVSEFLNEFKKEEGVTNIDSDVFKALPPEMQYEILHDIRLRSRVTSYERVQEMVRLSNTPMDFSKLQVQGVIRRSNVTQKLLTVNQAVSKMEETSRPGRIASQRNRQYILVKNDEGGWVLGGKKPTAGHSADKPVQLDSDEDEASAKEEFKEEDEEGWVSGDDDDVELEEVKISQPVMDHALHIDNKPVPRAAANPIQNTKIDDSSSLVNRLEAYMDEDEPIEKVMAKFAEIEETAAKKRALQSSARPIEGNMARKIENGGLRTIGEQDVIQVQEGARQHLAKGGLRLGNEEQWREVLSDGEELDSMDTVHSINSLDTLHSDNTLDYEDFDDMVEDEQTGEILSRQIYNSRHHTQDNGRALSTEEESRLDLEGFYDYWTGYTPDSFKIKHHNHGWMIRDAIYEWDENRLEGEVHSATRKLEKSNANDTLGLEALGFWKSFLESVLCRRLVQRAARSEVEESLRDLEESKENVLQALRKSGAQRKSRLSQLISLDDDDDNGVNDQDVGKLGLYGALYKREGSKSLDNSPALAPSQKLLTPAGTAIIETPGTTLTASSTQVLEESAVPRRPILDFHSSILKRQAPTATSETQRVSILSGSERGHVINSKPILPLDSIQVALTDEEIDMTTIINESTDDSGLGSLISSPTVDVKASPIPNVDRDLGSTLGDNVDMDLASEVAASAEKTELLTEDLEVDTRDVLRRKGDSEDEEEEDEDEAHEADFEDEEQDFTNLFPDMANLPGAILNPKEPLLSAKTLPERPALTAEEIEAREQQDARKMFEESKQLENEIKELQDQRRKHQRDADDLTESMVVETKMLLRLFGIPYLVAPMEAEAQCADLQIRGVVDGILTEDSDVFLFGGARIFKNMFKEEKYVECYLMSDIERDLGVGRDRLVALAYLLGSDYTTGIKGIGLITAMEIIRLFPKLEDFARWWRGEQSKLSGTDDAKDKDQSKGLTTSEMDSIDEIALEKLAKQCKKIHVPSLFPDPHVRDAYIRPLVDDDPAKFQWGIPDLDGLRDFLRRSLGWDRGEVDRVLLPIIRQMSSQQQTTQTSLDSFFDASAGTSSFQAPMRRNLHKSAKLRKIVDGLTGHGSPKASTDSDVVSEPKKGGKKTTTKRAPVKRKAATKEFKQPGDGNGYDERDTNA